MRWEGAFFLLESNVWLEELIGIVCGMEWSVFDVEIELRFERFLELFCGMEREVFVVKIELCFEVLFWFCLWNGMECF